MAALSDFNAPVKKPKLSDLFATGPTTHALLSPASISNVASNTAVIDYSQNLNGTYVRVSDELKYGTSDLAARVNRMFDETDQVRDYDIMMDIAADPSLPIEQRQAVVSGFVPPDTASRSFFDRTANAAAMANSEDDDNDETEMVRLDTSRSIYEVDAYNGWVQQEINRLEGLSNPNTFSLIRDAVLTMLPFYEQASGLQVSSQFLEGGMSAGNIAQAMALMGSNKEAVRDALMAMPPEQRRDMANKLMEVVVQSSGPTAFNQNHIVMMNELNAYLRGHSYGDEDAMLDNLFSLLDSTIIASPFIKAGEGIVGLARGATEGIRAGKAVERAERALKALDELPNAADEIAAVKADQPLLLEYKPAPAMSFADDVDNIIDNMPIEAPKVEYDELRANITNNIGQPGDIDNIINNSRIIDRMTSEQINDVRQSLGAIRDRKIAYDNPNFSIQYPTASNVARQRVRTTVSPKSVSQAYANTNAGKSRALHEATLNDKTGRMADIAYGTNKTDAMANDTLGEVRNMDGSVRNKVEFDEAAPAPDNTLVREIQEARGDIHFTKQEKAGLRAKAKDAWRDIQGMFPRTAMSTVGDNPRGVSFDMVYGPRDGGFSDANTAINQAKFALAKYGVTDKQIEVLKFDGTGYVPVKEWADRGNYLIRVKHEYEFSPADAVEWSLTKSGNWKMFDALPPMFSGSSGGLASHLIPSTAVVDKTLLDAASVAADRSAWIMKRLLELGNEYATKYKALDVNQKALVDGYIFKANAQGLKFNSQKLLSIGMTNKAVDALRSWKKVQDTLYHFENVDAIKTLRSRGFMHYIDNAGTDLIVKPVAINQTGDVRVVFDGEKVRPIDRKELAEVYAKGGTIAETRGVNEWGGEAFNYVVVRNTSDSSYLRQISDSDQILTYRDGYYTVRYTNPYFLRKQVKTKDGSTYWKAIATAADRKTADAELARLKATDVEGEYALTGDLKKGSTEYDDIQWESMVNNGRTAQRIRGQRLAEAGSTESDLNKLFIESPEESLIKSIASLSNRVSHRDFIETAKKRYTNQFGHLLTKKKGVVQWPSDVREIAKENAAASIGEVADARATWRYIEAVDSGYVNLIDDASKNFFKFFSDVAGRAGWSHLESGLRAAEEFGPTGWARKKAFRLLLAYNPLRQLPVQAMQALPVILATNPTAIPRIANQFMLLNYIARGGDTNSFFKAMAKQATGLTKEQANDLVKNYELSGFEASVKANSLIRDDMKGLVDRGIAQKAGRVVGRPGDFLQKIGFEAGENLLMRSVWLSEYDRLLRAKKGGKIGMDDLETLNAKVRHLTLNMNRAGELPYNENFLSAFMQFFQAPHKAFAQVVMGHKGLTNSERFRLGALYITTYGLGANYITDMISKIVPENSGLRDAIEGGVFNILLNRTLSSLYGQDVNTDFSDSLRLFTVPNFVQFTKDLLGLQFGEMITNSPSASLVFGDNPRVTRFVKSVMRPFTIENGWTPEEFQHVGVTFLNIFSGGSNIWKAKYILEHHKQVGSMGQTIDWESNYVEAILKAGGFATMDEVRYYALNDKTYKASQAFKDDINNFVKETSRRLALEGISNQDAEYWLKMMAEAQRIYGFDPDANKEIMDQIEFRASINEGSIIDTLYRLAPITKEEDMQSMIDIAPITDEQKQQIRDAVKLVNEE